MSHIEGMDRTDRTVGLLEQSQPLNKGNPSDLTEVVMPEPRQEWAEVAGKEWGHKWRE